MSIATMMATAYPHLEAVAERAEAGDLVAAAMIHDFALEEGLTLMPFEAGKCYLICTLTLYYLGRVKAATFGHVELEDAAWVHWTGRLSTLLATGKWDRGRARVEPCKTGVLVSAAAIVSAYPWPFSLPTEAVP